MLFALCLLKVLKLQLCIVTSWRSNRNSEIHCTVKTKQTKNTSKKKNKEEKGKVSQNHMLLFIECNVPGGHSTRFSVTSTAPFDA